jgi:hypothetical protein
MLRTTRQERWVRIGSWAPMLDTCVSNLCAHQRTHAHEYVTDSDCEVHTKAKRLFGIS